MFGFIKMFQRFLNRLKSNKRLWFTSLFIISTIGVTVSIFALVSLTDKVSQEIYTGQTKEFMLKYKAFEKLKERELAMLSALVSNDETFMDIAQKNDTAGIAAYQERLNTKIFKQEKYLSSFKFYALQNKTETFRNSIITAIQTKNSIFGLEVLFDGIFYVYLLPVLKDDNVIGVMEFKESIYTGKEIFEVLNQEFAFLLDKKMLSLLSRQSREGVYQEVANNYLLDAKIYDNDISSYLLSLDENSLQGIARGGYVVGRDFFINGELLRDTNGVDIGMLIMGESVDTQGGFINMAKKMSNQVVTIVLGLIISLLLSLF